VGRKDKLIVAENPEALPVGMRLRYVRQRGNVSLTEMAARLVYSKGYLSGIENGNIRVSEDLVRRYEEALNLERGELSDLVQAIRAVEPGRKQHLWYVPHQRNLFFTGRDLLLDELRRRLSSSAIAPTVLALTGLGGIGKTQLAVEYAYRFKEAYRAVLWLYADTPGRLMASCVDVATYLDLPEKNAQEQQITVSILQRWLGENPGCLIVLDNVDDPRTVSDFLSRLGNSHIILTTRMQSVGAVAQTLELNELSMDESKLLLLRRAKVIPLNLPLSEVNEATSALAQSIVDKMAGLPLALNQAGSYIEETGCGLTGYYNLLTQQQARILQATHQFLPDYHASVGATWALSLDKIRQSNPAAVELLYFCAFLNPDKIYEEFITTGAHALGPVLQPIAADPFELHRAVGALRKYSLIRTDPETGALSIHRLGQVVIQDMLEQEMRRTWVERVIGAISEAFPLVTVALWHETWAKCQRYFPQAEAGIALVEQWDILTPAAAHLLMKAGKYLEERSQYRAAESYYRRALHINKQLYGSQDLFVASSLSDLALVCEKQGKYERAEELYRQALLIQDTVVGIEQSSVALVRNYVNLLHKLERAGEAATLSQRTRRMQSEGEPEVLLRLPINDSDPHILYGEDGQWYSRHHPGDFHSDAHATSAPGAWFQYRFSGIGVEVVSDTSSVHGEVDIYIDGTYVQTVNTARISNQLTQTIIFITNSLEPGEHTLKVVVQSGTFVLDALAVFTYEREPAGVMDGEEEE
jgi:transcriptional regulator with XRE-family HTH domain/tetratricopeptide (TPR) repeat protein